MENQFLTPEEREYFSGGMSVRKQLARNYREYEKEIEDERKNCGIVENCK